MSTGKHLKIKKMGDDVMGVELEGNPAKPEPIHFRVRIPGGDVDIARTTAGKHWVHVRVNNPRATSFNPTAEVGRIEEARADFGDRGVQVPVDVAPDLYHLAVLTSRVAGEEDRGQYEISQRRLAPRCADEEGCRVPASRTRPDGTLTCGNHEADTPSAQVRIEDCTLMISGSSVWVNSAEGVCVLRLQFGTAFELNRADRSEVHPQLDVRAETGFGVFTPGKS